MSYPKPAGWDDFIVGDNRQFQLIFDIGSFFDPSSEQDATYDQSMLPPSNPAQLIDGVLEAQYDYVLFDHGGIPTTPNNMEVLAPLSPDTYSTGVISDKISDENGIIDWTLTINFTTTHRSSLSLFFVPGELPKDFDVIFNLNGSSTGVLMVRDHAGTTWYGPNQYYEYDQIQIHVLTTHEPLQHVQIIEINYGSTTRMGDGQLTGESHMIFEHDPLGLTTPINQVDFSVLNLFGEFDSDNPNSPFNTISEENELHVTLTSKRNPLWTVPMGTFYLVSIEANDRTAKIVAQDVRYLVHKMYKRWTFTAGLLQPSIGDQLEEYFEGTEIDLAIDQWLYERDFPSGVEFDASHCMLSTLSTVAQAVGAEIWVTRDNKLHIGTIPSAYVGLIERDAMATYANININKPYNFLSVIYDPDLTSQRSQDTDFRFPGESLKNVLTVDNPFIETTGDAQTITDHLSPIMRQINKRGGKFFGNPIFDVWDRFKIQSRFTTDEMALPETYITKMEYVYTGILTCKIEGQY